jgi:hypothetical protein
MSDQFKFKLWEWAEWGSKLILTAIAALLWQTYLDVQKINLAQVENERRISMLEAKQESLLSKQEAMELMKRTELLIQSLVKEEEIKRLREERVKP